jgi:hypothetical protein
MDIILFLETIVHCRRYARYNFGARGGCLQDFEVNKYPNSAQHSPCYTFFSPEPATNMSSTMLGYRSTLIKRSCHEKQPLSIFEQLYDASQGHTAYMSTMETQKSSAYATDVHT